MQRELSEHLISALGNFEVDSFIKIVLEIKKLTKIVFTFIINFRTLLRLRPLMMFRGGGLRICDNMLFYFCKTL